MRSNSRDPRLRGQVAAMCALANVNNGYLESHIRVTERDATGAASKADFDVFDAGGAKVTKSYTYQDVWNAPSDRLGEAW